MSPNQQKAWSVHSWKERTMAQAIPYPDQAELDAVVRDLGQKPPLVTSWEIERLKSHLAEAEEGRRLVLQGGDCAETLADCRSDIISNKLKILLQMSLVLVQACKKPVVRIGRFAGQYGKPRSKTHETRTTDDGTATTLPSYFGDLVNRTEFDERSRKVNPKLLLDAYKHSAMTLNFIRSLAEGGFADFHHPEYWDLSFFRKADLRADLRAEYEETVRQLGESLRFHGSAGRILGRGALAR